MDGGIPLKVVATASRTVHVGISSSAHMTAKKLCHLPVLLCVVGRPLAPALVCDRKPPACLPEGMREGKGERGGWWVVWGP